MKILLVLFCTIAFSLDGFGQDYEEPDYKDSIEIEESMVYANDAIAVAKEEAERRRAEFEESRRDLIVEED